MVVEVPSFILGAMLAGDFLCLPLWLLLRRSDKRIDAMGVQHSVERRYIIGEIRAMTVALDGFTEAFHDMKTMLETKLVVRRAKREG